MEIIDLYEFLQQQQNNKSASTHDSAAIANWISQTLGNQPPSDTQTMIQYLMRMWSMGNDELSQDQQAKFQDLLLAYVDKIQDRDYSSPSATLSRLLATGMSRDAALQLLSGSVPGSGSSLPVSPLSPSAIDQGNLDVRRKEFVANTIFGSIQAATSLASLGVSASQARSLSTNSDVQTDLLRRTTDGNIRGALAFAELTKFASSLGMSEQELDAKIKSPLALRNWLAEYPDDPYASNALKSFDNAQADYFGQVGFRSAYDSYTAQRNYKPSYEDGVRNNRLIDAEIRLKTISADSVSEGIFQAWSQIEIAQQQLRSNMKVAESQIDLNNAQVDLLNVQYQAQYQENALRQPEVDATNANAQALFDMYSRDIFLQTSAFAAQYGLGTENFSQNFKRYLQMYSTNEDFKFTVATLNQLVASNSLSAYEKAYSNNGVKGFLQFLEVWRNSGMNTFAGDVLNIMAIPAAAHTKVVPVIKSMLK